MCILCSLSVYTMSFYARSRFTPFLIIASCTNLLAVFESTETYPWSFQRSLPISIRLIWIEFQVFESLVLDILNRTGRLVGVCLQSFLHSGNWPVAWFSELGVFLELSLCLCLAQIWTLYIQQVFSLHFEGFLLAGPSSPQEFHKWSFSFCLAVFGECYTIKYLMAPVYLRTGLALVLLPSVLG